MSAATARGAGMRLVGLDLFRAIAVFGMLVAHVGPDAWTPGEGWGTVHPVWELFHSHMPAMFAFAAGLSLTLGSGARRTGRREQIVPTLVRAALLAACGAALTALGTPVAVILPAFALWFVLALPFARMRARTLVMTAAVWAVAGPVASFALRRAFTDATGPVWSALVAGDYPALTWMPFVLAGFGMGRLDLSLVRVRAAAAATGGVLVVLAYGAPAAVGAMIGADRVAASLSGVATPGARAAFARLFFGESGTTPTLHPAWLVVPAPHSGSITDVIGCWGVCLLLLVGCLVVGDAAASVRRQASAAARLAARTVLAVAATGAMVLSVYAAHIVVMAVVTSLTGHSFGGGQSVAMLAAFTVGLAAAAALWQRVAGRGPLETLLSRAAALIARTGTRGSAGSSPPSQP